jgi:tricarballylate dehydrogenase
LIAQLDIDDQKQALETVLEFNRAARDPAEGFDPSVRDGLSTKGLDLEKTNWAIPIDKPPFHAYSVTGGITFTFGGLKVDRNAQVVGTDWRPIKGLYACGEMIGGLFYDNYPAGTGLVSGATFGRIAGASAAGKVSSVQEIKNAGVTAPAPQINFGLAAHSDVGSAANSQEDWIP